MNDQADGEVEGRLEGQVDRRMEMLAIHLVSWWEPFIQQLIIEYQAYIKHFTMHFHITTALFLFPVSIHFCRNPPPSPSALEGEGLREENSCICVSIPTSGIKFKKIFFLHVIPKTRLNVLLSHFKIFRVSLICPMTGGQMGWTGCSHSVPSLRFHIPPSIFQTLYSWF